MDNVSPSTAESAAFKKLRAVVSSISSLERHSKTLGLLEITLIVLGAPVVGSGVRSVT